MGCELDVELARGKSTDRSKNTLNDGKGEKQIYKNGFGVPGPDLKRRRLAPSK